MDGLSNNRNISSGMDGLSQNGSVVRNEWVVREQIWINSERTRGVMNGCVVWEQIWMNSEREQVLS